MWQTGVKGRGAWRGMQGAVQCGGARRSAKWAVQDVGCKVGSTKWVVQGGRYKARVQGTGCEMGRCKVGGARHRMQDGGARWAVQEGAARQGEMGNT